MSRRQQPCKYFLNGNCRFGANCKFSHATQNQNQNQNQNQRNATTTTNPFGFGGQRQNTSQFTQSSQIQSKPNPFGFGVQNTNTNQTNQFENKWSRASSSSAKQPESQPSVHVCSDPESCKKVMIEDSKNEAPLWKLTCYGHAKNGPCDITGDISFEELRALAYEESKQGRPLQSIVERERNLLQSKLLEFDNLLRNPYIPKNPNSGPSPTGFSQFGGPQNNAAPTITSFGQLGVANKPFGQPSLTPPSSSPFSFGQPNIFQNNSQSSAQPEMKFGTSSGSFGTQMGNINQVTAAPTNNVSNFAFGRSLNTNTNATNTNANASGFGSSFLQPSSSSIPNNNNNNNNNNSSKQQSFSLGFGFLAASPVQAQEKQVESIEDAIWLKEKWSIGEIPEEAPPPARCC